MKLEFGPSCYGLKASTLYHWSIDETRCLNFERAPSQTKSSQTQVAATIFVY